MERLLSALVIFGPPVGCIVVLLLVFHILRRHRLKSRPVLAYPDIPDSVDTPAVAAAMNLRHDLELVGELTMTEDGASNEEIYRAYLTPFVPISDRRLRKMPLVLLMARRLGQIDDRSKEARPFIVVAQEARRKAAPYLK
jgi:hypothetical protein